MSTIILPDPAFNEWRGYIVFVALPHEDGADGLVTYALGPFDTADEAQLAARAAERDNPDAFVRCTPLRKPAQCEHPITSVVTTEIRPT